ncbi:MAG: c-type cytochrome [Anaerolineales bacterium]|nr:c-type cytochrome [Anaerolineales bacterium]
MTHKKPFIKPFVYALLPLLGLVLVGCGAIPANPVTVNPASVNEIAAGNAENGQKLFMGYTHFEYEGPPCMGCHGIGDDDGLLGGGALGPNLTNTAAEKTDDDIIGILSNTGIVISPVMRPIYTDFPLTPQEQADLLAFMKSSVGQPETDKEGLIYGISFIGTLGVALALGFIYRNRLRSVRRALVNKAEKELQ